MLIDALKTGALRPTLGAQLVCRPHHPGGRRHRKGSVMYAKNRKKDLSRASAPDKTLILSDREYLRQLHAAAAESLGMSYGEYIHMLPMDPEEYKKVMSKLIIG